MGAAQSGGSCPKQQSSTRSRTNQRLMPRKTGGDWQDGVPVFRGSVVDEGAAEPLSQDGTDGLRGSGPDRQMERLMSVNQGQRATKPLADLGRVILSLQRNKLRRRSTRWTITEMQCDADASRLSGPGDPGAPGALVTASIGSAAGCETTNNGPRLATVWRSLDLEQAVDQPLTSHAF